MLGRPSAYSDDLADAICEHIVSGLSIREIGEKPEMPAPSTIWRWAATNQNFQERYARAMEVRAERFAEELLEIADDGTNDWMSRQGDDGETIRVLDHEHVQRSKLRIDSRKWLMAKMAPKKYGDKVNLEHSGAVTFEQAVTEAAARRKGGAG